MNVADELEKNFDGIVPDTKEELLKLPGIGPYIANAVLASAYNKRVAVLDTNIIRILERFFEIRSSKTRARTDPILWGVAQRLLPKKTNICKTWNYALLDFGALVCSHYNPQCKECPCRRRCNYFSSL
jgi:A/G-specific adenine glycosylase